MTEQRVRRVLCFSGGDYGKDPSSWKVRDDRPAPTILSCALASNSERCTPVSGAIRGIVVEYVVEE